MKALRIIFVATAICIHSFAYSQVDNFQNKDSVDIAMEREVISKSLMQLRDSLNQTIRALDEKRMIAPPKAKHPMDKATRELLQHRDKMERNMDEVVQISKKGWDTNTMIRIKSSIEDARRDYKRIRLDIKPYLSTTKS